MSSRGWSVCGRARVLLSIFLYRGDSISQHRFLLSQPQPWGLGAKCADVRIAAEFCKVVVKYRRIFPGTNVNEVWYRFGTRSYHDISIWIQQLSVKLPAILINLARRPDR